MVETESFIEEKITEIGDAIGDANAVIALSGGVDSSTAAALAYEAVGDQLAPVYVDTGLMRKGETEGIRETFAYMDSLRIVDARERFLDELAGITDPEAKRHAIGEQFIREFETVAREVDADSLVQIVEPMRDLYKDEVREVARALDLEEVVSERMPFPGPGLAVRIIGEVTEEKLAVAREANHVVEEELEEYDPWQALAAVIGKATGVKGDNRVHGWVVAVRSVESRDGMTARAQDIDWETLQRIQSRVTGENENVARVLYDVTHKPPATIEYE
ncbi:glutamine-hydrolyzing GMP synthase subunit GuaA [Halobacteriales archaeon QH_6_68_27]|nr:MAG: glutamine-hydrolyzing GMP synthase subunit GuaA [Halobacteriales archaeon QH_6_68_27]